MKFEEAWADTAKQNQFLKGIVGLSLIATLLVCFLLGKQLLSHRSSSKEHVTPESLRTMILLQQIGR